MIGEHLIKNSLNPLDRGQFDFSNEREIIDFDRNEYMTNHHYTAFERKLEI